MPDVPPIADSLALLFDPQAYVGDAWLPDESQLQHWVMLALDGNDNTGQFDASVTELSVAYLSEHDMQELNQTYRDKHSSTNVLSFPADMPVVVNDHAASLCVLGDLALCPPVIEREADQQSKLLEHHWAHMVIHGTLHLIGMDHLTEKDTIIMESREIQLLSELAIENPYTQPHRLTDQ